MMLNVAVIAPLAVCRYVILRLVGSICIGTSLPLPKIPSPPDRTTLIVLTLRLAGSMFSSKAIVTGIAVVEAGGVSVPEDGETPVTCGLVVSTMKAAAAPELRNELSGAVGESETLPLWSTIRTLASEAPPSSLVVPGGGGRQVRAEDPAWPDVPGRVRQRGGDLDREVAVGVGGAHPGVHQVEHPRCPGSRCRCRPCRPGPGWPAGRRR